MRRIIIALSLTFALGGCATLPSIGAIQTAVQLGTATVANPVTPTRLNQMESAVTLVFVGLNAWKSSCKQGLINAACKTQIAAVQVYTRQVPPYLKQLRGFVRVNDQVNAVAVFNVLTDLIGTVKSQAAASGQQIGS